MSPGSRRREKKCLSTSIQPNVQSTQQQADCQSSGNKLLTSSPDLFPVWCCVQNRSGFVLFYYGVFFLTPHHQPCSPSLPPSLFLSPLVKSCSRWGDRAQHAATGSPGNLCPSVQKHVLTVCATSGGLFTQQSHSSRLPHDTICMTGSVLTPWKSKTVVTNERRKKNGVNHCNCVQEALERVAGAGKRAEQSYL